VDKAMILLGLPRFINGGAADGDPVVAIGGEQHLALVRPLGSKGTMARCTAMTWR